MDKLVYLYYILLPLLLFFGAKVMKKGEWNDEVMSFDHTKAFLGFASIIIIFHHASQRTCAPWLPGEHIHHGLDPFVFVGYLCVASFFFCSGYGMYSAHKKKNFFKHYFMRRIAPLLIPTAIMIAVAYYTEQARMIHIPSPKIINAYNYTWYIIAMIFILLVFYISCYIFESDKVKLGVIWGGVILYIILAIIFTPGTWWYNTPHLFAVGATLAANKEARMERYKRGWLPRVIIYPIVTFIAFFISNYYVGFISIIGVKYNPAAHGIVEFIGQMISAYTFAIFVMLIGMKVKIGNPVLKFLGRFTLETYLIHPYFVHVFGFAFILDTTKPIFYIENQFLYLLAIMVISIPLAFITNFLIRLLKKKFS